jgi:putative ABC transport system ATP-binding protein
MIHADGITKAFGHPGMEVLAVDDVHLDVQPAEFVLILGRSGSGKSTLLGMLAGLIHPSRGTVSIHGQEIGNMSEDQAAELRAKEIGFVFQFSGLITTITALENVLLPTLFCPGGPGSRLKAEEMLRKVGLGQRADAYPCTLSSGEMKRVAIARALINGPSLLIADEPTGDLDVDTEIEIMDLFRALNKEGMTIVIVTHNPDLVPYASRTFGMDHGKLVKGPMGFCSMYGKQRAGPKETTEPHET